MLAPERARQQAAGLSRAYRVNLTMLAVIALVTGGFLVFSTQALSVVRRRTEFAFLRAIGLARQELMRWLLAEGAIGGRHRGCGRRRAGLRPGGCGLDPAGRRPRRRLLRGDHAAARLEPIVVAVFSRWAPWRGWWERGCPHARRPPVSPAMALKSGGDAAALGGGRRHPGWALGGGAARWRGLPGSALGGDSGGRLCRGRAVAAGRVFALPMLAARLSRVLAPLRMVPVTLARSRLAAVPGHVVVAGAGVLASAALAVAMAIMVASFRHSVDDWLAQILPAELYARGARAGSSGYFDPAAQALIAGTPGVAKVDFIRHDTVLLAPDRPRWC